MPTRTKRLLGLFAVFVLVLTTGVAVVRFNHAGASSADLTEATTPRYDAPASTPAGPQAATSPAATPSAVAEELTAAQVASLKAKAAARARTAADARAKAVAKATARAGAVAAGRRVASRKKGASVWKSAGLKASLADSGVSWYYDWASGHDGISAPSGVEFVPMIWGPASVTTANLAAAKSHGSTLLGFNEPDMGAQSNMSVDDALAAWPKLEATGLRLGSPAVAWGADQQGQWLDRFMAGAGSRGYRVDFIALHWYGSDFTTSAAVSQLHTYLAATYARYHKPIWLTEYGLTNFSGSPTFPSADNQAAFVTASTTMLQSLPYVERYAWFAFPTPTDGSQGTGLYWPGNTPTAMGKAYRAAG